VRLISHGGTLQRSQHVVSIRVVQNLERHNRDRPTGKKERGEPAGTEKEKRHGGDSLLHEKWHIFSRQLKKAPAGDTLRGRKSKWPKRPKKR